MKSSSAFQRTNADLNNAAPSRASSLVQRLDDGYTRIDQAIQRGEDTERWETFWIDLLHEYESLHDGMPEAA